MQVYKSQFLKLMFFEEYKLIEMIWFPETENMTEEEFKQEQLNYLDIIKKLKPNKVLPDTREMNFPVSPKMQEWTNKTLFPPSLEMGLNKAAIVASKEFITELSVEQTMEEVFGQKFITKYFNNREDAKKWIVSE